MRFSPSKPHTASARFIFVRSHILSGKKYKSINLMSNRPRSHQIEDQSRIAFEKCLPKQWVYRPVRPDYGIDGVVEMFDEQGCATGKHFNVQLRATDAPNLASALTVKLKIERCEYYRRLDLPVLIARFHVPTGRMFVRWFHEFDPYYSKGGTKTRTLKLAVSDEWLNGTPSRLSLDLERIRKLRSGDLPSPVTFCVRFCEDLIQGLTASAIALNLRKALRAIPGVVTIIPDASLAYGSISISNGEAVVNLSGLKSFTLHFREPYGVHRAKKFLHNDLLLAVALTLDSAGFPERAAKLVAEFAGRSSLVSNPEIVIRVAHCMANGHRVHEALELANGLLIDPSSKLTAHVLLVSLLAGLRDISQNERELIKGSLVRYVEIEERTGDNLAAATANYNLGNYLRSLSFHRAALRGYQKAAKLDKRYLQRSYFYRELAGVLFQSKRYRIAAKLYDRSLQLGEQGIARALLGDALMFSGRFSEALQTYEIYLSGNEKAESEFFLKAWALKGLQLMLNIPSQQRQRTEALKLASPDQLLPIDEYRNRLLDALRLDALCGLAWFNLGICLVRQAKQEDAFVAFLWTSLVQGKDAEAWANACALSACSSKYSGLLPDIVRAGNFACGAPFIEQLLKISDAQPTGFPKQTFLSVINDVLAHTPEQERPFDLRLIDENGNVKVFPKRPPSKAES